MINYNIRCNNCDFLGEEEDLVQVVEFKETEKSQIEYLTLEDFNSRYTDLGKVYKSEIINGCPECLMDSYLMDICEIEEY
ncbi:MAG: hypothetical protein IJH34_01595 [Romboutsia sp.]|nr:hypothetical protein [Romboutsia sp.]